LIRSVPPGMVATEKDDALNAQVSAAPVVAAGSVKFGNDLPISIIAGPCQLESRAHALEVASALKEIAARLGIGIVVNSQRARLASAVVIALTILKAFLIDMSTLSGVYRALSFMCLGLVLVAIGWLYQRILFRRQAPPAAPSGT